MPEQATKKRNPKGEGWYVVNKDKTVTNKIYYTDANGIKSVKSFRGKNKTEAKRLREEWEHNNAVKSHPETVLSMPISDYMFAWLKTYKQESVGECAYDSIEDCIESRVKKYDLGKYQVNQITLDIMQNYINQLVEDGYSRATIVKTRNILNGCFEKAYVKGDIVKNPMIGLELPSERKVKTKAKKIRFYTPSDVEKIYLEADKRFTTGSPVYKHGLIIILMMFTGIRLGECQGLKWKCVDFDNKTIRIENTITRIKNRDAKNKNKTLYKDSIPKSSSSFRNIPLSQKAFYAIQEMYRRNDGFNGDEDYVAQSEQHNIISERNLRRSLHSIEKNAGTSIQGAGIHVLRHTFASYMIYKGANLIALSKILGHSKPSVTSDIYVDIIDEQKEDAISVLDK